MARIETGGAVATLIREFERPSVCALRIGLTGGIGSGKSSATRALADRGALVADADEIAREVVAPGTEGLRLVVERFGGGVLDEDGALDRAALGRIVFADPRARADLEALTHPLIAQRAAAILAGAVVGGLAVYDVPLLVEKDMAPLFDAVIVVDAPQETRIARLETRGIGREDALARIASQAREAERRSIAHVWIENSGTPDDLVALVARVDEVWLRPAQGGPTA
ncbi:dephospho-CoA kinase [Actinomyces culturomici]|uniref:dephospho-CoA kinase n=1 Tax=Actinomyces culturomici TaxID=1926276 RepID=UPI000E2022AD|nr:dephospho-CoA kinase [Actinomyces culturomici]